MIETDLTLLSLTFHVKDLGALTYFFGLEIKRTPQGIYVQSFINVSMQNIGSDQ